MDDRKINIYVSCPIRGVKTDPEEYGTDEVSEAVSLNCQKVTHFCRNLQVHFNDDDYYIHNPGGPCLETFVHMGYINGLLPEKTILDIDVKIVEASDVVVFYNHEGQYSRGMMVERAAVEESGIEWIEVNDLVDFPKLARAIRKAVRRRYEQ